MKPKHWIPLALVALVALAAPAAYAAENNSFDRIIDLYRNGAENWEGPLLTVAKRLFGLLVLCEFSWAMIRQVLKGADLADFMGEIINQVMFIGFFLFLMTNSTDLAHAIIDSFRKAGDMASTSSGGSAGVRPSDIFEAGLKIATTTLKAALDSGMSGIPQAIGLIISAVFTLCAFALIGAYMIIALVESYIISSAGVLMMGFGGSRMTKDYAVKTLTFAVSVGAKLFVMQLIVGLGEGLMKTMAAGITPGTMMKPEDIFTMLGFSIVLVVLTKTIPDQVQGLINGVSANSSGNMMAQAVSGAVGGAVGGALGAGNAVAQSFRLASQQLAGEGGGESGGKGEGAEGGGGKLAAVKAFAGQAAKLGGAAAGNLAGAAANDFGARLAGHGRHGSLGGRMAHSMAQQTRELAREQASPQKAMSGGEKKDAGAAAASADAASSAAGSIRPETAEAGNEGGSTVGGASPSAADGGEGAGAGAGGGATSGDQTSASNDEVSGAEKAGGGQGTTASEGGHGAGAESSADQVDGAQGPANNPAGQKPEAHDGSDSDQNNTITGAGTNEGSPGQQSPDDYPDDWKRD